MSWFAFNLIQIKGKPLLGAQYRNILRPAGRACGT